MKKTFTLIVALIGVAFAGNAQQNQSTQRIPLHEGFSSSTCGPCVSANINMQNVFNANPNKYTSIKYQMNWPGSGDIYYTSEGGSRRSYYAVNSIPYLFVDGTNFSPNSYSSLDLDNNYNVPAEMTISATYSVINKVVTVNTVYTPLSNNSSTIIRGQTAVVEKTTTANKSSNGETLFHNVMKKMMPNASGIGLGALTANTPINQNNLTYTFGTGATVENYNNLAVIVFAQNNADKTVLQSTWATLLTGVTEIEKPGNGITALFPNPASNLANVSYQLTENRNVKLSIVNVLGEEVYAANEGEKAPGNYDLEINTSSLSNGIYFVNLTLGNNTHTSKISIEK